MKTKCSRSPGSFQWVACSIRLTQFFKCRIQATVIYHICFGNQRSNFFDCGKDSCLFSPGMPDQYFVKKPEAPDGGIKSFLSFCRVIRCGIDMLQVIPESIMNRPYRIN